MQPNTLHHASSNACCTVTGGFTPPSRSYRAYTDRSSCCGHFHVLYDFCIACACGSIFVYWKSFSRKYFTFICENSKLHNTLFKMFPIWFLSHPFYGDHLFPESKVSVQIQHMVLSQDYSQRMYPSFYSVLLSLLLAAFILAQMLFHSCCVLYKQNRCL